MLFISNGIQASELLIFGDSIFAYPFSKKVGSHLSSHMKVKRFAQVGACLIEENADKALPSFINFLMNENRKVLVDQVKNHISEVDNRSVVLIDGGGNDLLIEGPTCYEQDCQELMYQLAASLEYTLDLLADNGNNRVILYIYHKLGGKLGYLNSSVNFGAEIYEDVCNRFNGECIIIDGRKTLRR